MCIYIAAAFNKRLGRSDRVGKLYWLSSCYSREMLTGAPGALVKEANIVIFALKDV